MAQLLPCNYVHGGAFNFINRMLLELDVSHTNPSQSGQSAAAPAYAALPREKPTAMAHGNTFTLKDISHSP